MKIKKLSKLFINERALLSALNTGENLNKPVGFAYCEEQEDTSCAVFLGTDRETGEIHRTKGGELQFNIKVDNARKKGEQVADTGAAEETPLDEAEVALAVARQEAATRAGLGTQEVDADIPL